MINDERGVEVHVRKDPRVLIAHDEFTQGEIAGISILNGFFCDYADSAPEAWAQLLFNKGDYKFIITGNALAPPKIKFGPNLEKFLDNYDYSTNGKFFNLRWKPHDPKDNAGNEGLALIRRIRQNEKYNSIGIIMYQCGGGENIANFDNVLYLGGESRIHTLNKILGYFGRELNSSNKIIAESSNNGNGKPRFFKYLERLMSSKS